MDLTLFPQIEPSGDKAKRTEPNAVDNPSPLANKLDSNPYQFD